MSNNSFWVLKKQVLLKFQLLFSLVEEAGGGGGGRQEGPILCTPGIRSYLYRNNLRSFPQRLELDKGHGDNGAITPCVKRSSGTPAKNTATCGNGMAPSIIDTTCFTAHKWQRVKADLHNTVCSIQLSGRCMWFTIYLGK